MTSLLKISTILDHIDNGHMGLPEFQRGYVWKREQVRMLFDSLYQNHPIGGLLVWEAATNAVVRRGSESNANNEVQLLLDGQQRMTSIYGVVRGKPPEFFDGNDRAFTGLHFHLGTESFAFYQPKMKDDPFWIDVTELMQAGTQQLGKFVSRLPTPPESEEAPDFIGRLLQLHGIRDIQLHIDEMTEKEKPLDVVVDIFNRVNSRGTKLSKGDLALARVCVEWPDMRQQMKVKLKAWADAGYTSFNFDWLLRCVNTILTGEAKFTHLHKREAAELQDGLERASRHINTLLNLIAGRLGLDHDRVFFGRLGVPVMVCYLDKKGGQLDEREQDKLLFWFAQAGMWGRFSASIETAIDQDLDALEGSGGGFDALIEQLRLWHSGGLKVEPSHFMSSGIGARFYPVLYMLTRMGEARDWGNGLPLRANMLGQGSRLEMHHIFPKAQLRNKHGQDDVNALANLCFLTQNTNLKIGSRPPEDYFPEVESKHPGALASQWIPMDESLWKIERYLDFLEARRELLAIEANKRFAELLQCDPQQLADPLPVSSSPTTATIDGGAGETEELKIEHLNKWVVEQRLPRGQVSFDYADPETGAQKAVFDLAWPDGLQPGLTEPVVVLLNGPASVLALASAAGFRCFTTEGDFQAYVKKEILEPEIV